MLHCIHCLDGSAIYRNITLAMACNLSGNNHQRALRHGIQMLTCHGPSLQLPVMMNELLSIHIHH
jgi:hypothetical protein